MANDIIKVGNFFTKPLGLDMEKQQKENDRQKKILEGTASDIKDFSKFTAQEDNLLNTASQELFNPKYKVRGDLAKQTEALAQIFNARKSEALQRRSSPGITQTRSV
jgi:hypothetical protein